ncbi:hypothetical protein ANTQUA_LOCUS6368 [Anthophora quadrimaculata]
MLTHPSKPPGKTLADGFRHYREKLKMTNPLYSCPNVIHLYPMGKWARTWIREEWTDASNHAAFRDLRGLIEINRRHRPDCHGSFSLPPEDSTRFVTVVTVIPAWISLDLTYQRRLEYTLIKKRR